MKDLKTKLDEKDLMLLNRLQENGRETYSNLAKALKVSEAAVYMRVNRLIRSGFIRSFTAILDESKLSLNITAFVSVRANPTKYERVLQELSEMPEVLEVHDVTGDYYALLKVKTRSKEDLSELLNRIGLLEGVISTETKIVLKTLKETVKLPLDIIDRKKSALTKINE
ncbi:MAG: Lrp/AsnC family transcriptional regulator [Aigarchaeota archaeon]|nr:Lrp/AsnC family transcriptional regulator [Aigarchaeota archaeon]MDW8093214.1 Lrp/AsnC family transcriptional regulator [Nitrososphaerota archaeon]